METAKTANQLYKESGSTVSFTEWLEQEKQKGVFIKNDTLTKIVENALQVKESTDSKPMQKSDTFLGLSKPIIIISALTIVSAIAYKIYSSKRK